MTLDVVKVIPEPKRSILLPTRSKKPVRRSLFGAVDHDEAMNFLKNELQNINRLNSEKWNFDFQSERPITNTVNVNYEWQPVMPSDDIPKAYALPSCPYLATHAADVKEEDSIEVIDETSLQKRSVQRTILDYWKPKKSHQTAEPVTEKTEDSYHENYSKRLRLS